jgi:hypothetical protein
MNEQVVAKEMKDEAMIARQQAEVARRAVSKIIGRSGSELKETVVDQALEIHRLKQRLQGLADTEPPENQ